MQLTRSIKKLGKWYHYLNIIGIKINHSHYILIKKMLSPFSLAPLFILIILASFSTCLVKGMTHMTVACARQSCRMTATCMTAASFPNSVSQAVGDVCEGRRSCCSSSNAWIWHTPCTWSLMVCCLPEHELIVCSQDVI